MDVDTLAEIPHRAFEQATEILRKDLLFGLTDERLGNLTINLQVPDNTADATPGYGLLAAHRDQSWVLMHLIMGDEKLYLHFFDNGGLIRRLPAISWLNKVEAFKRCMFILIHSLAGMPKEGTELASFKVANLPGEMRSFYSMFGYLTILGRTTANSHHNLHFLPQCVSNLILRFHYSVADLERWIVSQVYSREDSHWGAYFFSSHGRRWSSSRFSKILIDCFFPVTGARIGLQAFNNIMPAIAIHYLAGKKTVSRLSVLSDQMGHTADTGSRLYGRTTGGHHQLTHSFCHNTLDFCTNLHKLWGFDGLVPNIKRSKSFRQSIVHSENLTILRTFSELKDMVENLQNTLKARNSKLDALLQYLHRTGPLSVVPPSIPSAASSPSSHAKTITIPEVVHARSAAKPESCREEEMSDQGSDVEMVIIYLPFF